MADQAGKLGAGAEARRAFDAYTRAFSAADFETFQRYYTPDCVCELSGAGIRMDGRDAIVGFYRTMFARVREGLTLHQLIADDGGIAADITSTFTAIEDASDFAAMPLKLGETLSVRVFVYYTLRDGRISAIRVARFGQPQRG